MGLRGEWIVPVNRPVAPVASLFCFPYAGGGASVYRAWSRLVSPAVELLAVQPPGREDRFGEAPLTDRREYVALAAQAIAQRATRPFALFGHSLGAIVAYEVADSLSARGLHAKLLLASAHQAPGVASPRAPIAHLPDEAFLAEVARYNGTPADVLEHRELLDLLLPVLRADFALSERQPSAPSPEFTIPIVALGAHSDPWLDASALERWRHATRAAFAAHWFDGDHFYLVPQREALVAFVERQLLAG